MKERIIKEIEPTYRADGFIDRENSITLTIDEYVLEKRKKPYPEALIELKRQKKQILEAKKEEGFYPIDSIEVSISECLNAKKRGINRQMWLNEIIKLIKELQTSRNYTEISKDYILTILKHFTNFSERTRERLIKDILNKSTSKKERIVTKKCLVNKTHYEKRLVGERTKTPIKAIERVWETHEVYDNFYSFI